MAQLDAVLLGADLAGVLEQLVFELASLLVGLVDLMIEDAKAGLTLFDTCCQGDQLILHGCEG